MPNITRISVQSHRKDRYNVYVDGEFAFAISANDLLQFRIAKGDSITEKDIHRYKFSGAKSLLKDDVLNFISIRPRSTREIGTYIKKLSISVMTINP